MHKTKAWKHSHSVQRLILLMHVCDKLRDSTSKSFETPMASRDHTELDDPGLLTNDEHLGRFDIMFAIQTLARFGAAPQVTEF